MGHDFLERFIRLYLGLDEVAAPFTETPGVTASVLSIWTVSMHDSDSL